jgi:predicted RNA-binding protein with PIN domain
MLLIDGNTMSSPRRPWHPTSCDVRRRLVMDVARLTRDWASCADVVFDGYPRGGLRQGALVAAVQVWFSAWRSADDAIVERAMRHVPDELFIVTSDRELGRRVRVFGAVVVSSESRRRALDIACSAAHAARAPRAPLPTSPSALVALDGG